MDWLYFQDRNWVWCKFADKPDEETRNTLKTRWGARWGRKKMAWYIQQEVPIERLVEVLGKPLGSVEDRAPTKDWGYCMTLADSKTIPSKENNSKLASRFRSWADKMESQIENKRLPMTQNPTPKRMKEYQSRLHDANNLERGQKALYALADLHDKGEVPACLLDLKFKKDVLPLVRTRWASEGYYEGYDSGEYIYDTEPAKTLQALIGETVDPKQAEIDRLEAKATLRIGQIPGFFPTPEDLARNMVYMADIHAGAKVLEPSAGSGAIADVIREIHPDVDLEVIEPASTLRELLEAKGYKLIDYDFLEVDGKWDVIIMNPPFEKLQDINHVRHAYDCLNEGGTLVAIMSESPFFQSTKKAQAFRVWLDEVGHHRQHLEAGTFAPHTNIKTNLLVIEK